MKNQPFSISLDCSNHGASKMSPMVVRFFSKSKGIQNRLLDFELLKAEDSKEVLIQNNLLGYFFNFSNFELFSWTEKIITKHNLQFANISSFSADNAPVNFGSSVLGGNNNIFYRMRKKNPNIIPTKCCAHILHNAAQESADNLGVDVEAVVLKSASYFRSSTKRTEELKEFCDELEVLVFSRNKIL